MRGLYLRRALAVGAAVVLAGCAAFAQTAAKARPTSAAQASHRISVGDVVRLVQAHLGEEVILAQIRSKRQAFDLSADDLIRLKTAGASDALIRAMLEPPRVVGAPSAAFPARPEAVKAAAPVESARPGSTAPRGPIKVQWVSHSDPRGFTVSVPDNWTFSPDHTAGRTTIEGAEGQRAVIWPMFIEQQVPNGESAGALLQQLARKVEGQMVWAAPQISGNVARVLATGARQGAALLRWQSTPNGSVLYLFCVSAPASSYRASTGIFTGILTTFEVVPDRSAAAAEQAEPAVASQPPPEQIAWVQWTDPNEGAFRAEVPQGWSVSGGSRRLSATDIRHNLTIGSPNGQIRITVGDTSIGVFAVPNPSFARFQRQGGTQAVGDGTELQLHRYVPAAQFIRSYVEKTVARGCAGPQIVSTDERRDLADAAARDARSKGAPSPRVTAAGVQFTCSAGGTQMAGYYAAATTLVSIRMSTVWYVEPLFGYVAAPGRRREAEDVIHHVLQSMGINAQWQQMENGRAGEAVARDKAHAAEIQAEARRSIAENQQKTSDMITQGYDRRSKVYDEIARKRENSILGTVDVVDPNTGRQYKVDNYSDYHWMNNQGVIAGTRTDTAPGSDWQRMTTLP